MKKSVFAAWCMPVLAVFGAGCIYVDLSPSGNVTAAVAAAAAKSDRAAVNPQPAAKPDKENGSAEVMELKLPYRQFVIHPELSGKYSLAVLLHGSGERGDDNFIQLTHGARELAAYAEKTNRKCIVLVPQCPKDQSWSEHGGMLSPYGAAVLALIDRKSKEFDVDSKRIYLTGLSMGGYGTWTMVATRPEFFAAAIPICGGGNPEWGKSLSHTPLMVFHGAKDDAVNVENSRKMVAAVKAAGGNVTYVEYPDEKHFSWQPAYADDATFDWMFSNQRAE
ncbi:MAG: prolyl oligopeptidase family serine peptidase [Victivallaceae bacterium]|nr:prolyl oligopeptidase family serine peptidase [Victivallaceae bacterium]